MRGISLLIGVLFPALAFSSQPLQVSTEDLVNHSDHLLVGHVVGVDMIDGQGKKITDLDARTGPSSTNRIRLVVKVDEVVITNALSVPQTLKVPLDPMMHYKLRDVKASHSKESKPFLLLLEGSDFQPPFSGVFGRPLSEKEELITLIKSKKVKKPDGE